MDGWLIGLGGLWLARELWRKAGTGAATGEAAAPVAGDAEAYRAL
jgi:hypothetical protein